MSLFSAAAVRIFLWKPIHKILDERQAQANSMLTDAAKAKEEAEALIEEHKASMAGIEQEKAAAVAEAKKRAQSEGTRIVEEAKSRADSIVREAETEGQARKDEIIRQANNEITEIIVAATAKVAGVPGRRRQRSLRRVPEEGGGYAGVSPPKTTPSSASTSTSP